jgi:hypothetical protein
VKAKVSEAGEATGLRGRRDAWGIGSCSRYTNFSEQFVCFVTKPTAMAWLLRHVSAVEAAKMRQKDARTTVLLLAAAQWMVPNTAHILLHLATAAKLIVPTL